MRGEGGEGEPQRYAAVKSFLITLAYDLTAVDVLDCNAYDLSFTRDNISFELDFKPSFINDSHNYYVDVDFQVHHPPPSSHRLSNILKSHPISPNTSYQLK